jgi:hypothetical protein
MHTTLALMTLADHQEANPSVTDEELLGGAQAEGNGPRPRAPSRAGVSAVENPRGP